MKLTIEGTLEQILDALPLPPRTVQAIAKKGRTSAHATAKKRREEVSERRRLLHGAFMKVRYGEKTPTREILLQALTGKIPITQEILETARQVLEI